MLRHQHILLFFFIFHFQVTEILLLPSAEMEAEPEKDAADIDLESSEEEKSENNEIVDEEVTLLYRCCDIEIQHPGPVEIDAVNASSSAPEGSYFLTDDENRICIAAKLWPGFNIINGHKHLHHVKRTLGEPHVGGYCGSATSALHLYWEDAETKVVSCNLSLTFDLIKDGTEWALCRIEFQYNLTELFGHDALEVSKESRLLTAHTKEDQLVNSTNTPLGESFECDKSMFNLYDDDNDVQVVAEFANFKLQAFNVSSQFGPENKCVQSTKEISHEKPKKLQFRSDVAPVALGSTLALLTLAAVAGFAVYRTRTKNVDYATMG